MSIRIDIDFYEISDDVSDRELVDEVVHRIDSGLSDLYVDQIIKALEFPEQLVEFEIKTLDDEMKVEHLNKVFHKYTATQLEQLIPEI